MTFPTIRSSIFYRYKMAVCERQPGSWVDVKVSEKPPGSMSPDYPAGCWAAYRYSDV